MENTRSLKGVFGLPIRSALFVPGNRPDRIDKAVSTPADLVVIDLEDAVPLSQKAEARAAAREKTEAWPDRRAIVRVNGVDTDLFPMDLDVVFSPGLKGIMVPKVETRAQVLDIHGHLDRAETDAGIEKGAVSLCVMIESALGVVSSDDVLSALNRDEREVIAAFGAADYTVDLGTDISEDGTELIVPRSRIALASRVAGLHPPVDTPYMTDLKDHAGLERDARRAKQLGFQGKLCVHPAQIAVCNTVFSPSPEEIERAEKIVGAFEECVRTGQGVLQIDGKFVDAPIVERCRRILAAGRLLEGG